jgi:hypothetical protein
MTRRGPKRTKPLDGDTITSTTVRLPAALILRLDHEAVRIARETGLTTVNRSDVVRQLLERALSPK